MSDPDVIIRAPDVVEDHRLWLKTHITSLKSDGYEYFRAGFPDEDQRDLFLEAWKVQPQEMGPAPWLRPDYVPRQRLAPSLSVKAKDDLCLLDGSPVPKDGVSHTRKQRDGQQFSYVVMSEERMKSLPVVAPIRTKVRHLRCSTATEMHVKMAHTIARDPKFYKALFCAHCRAHFRTGKDGEFIWMSSDQKVGA